MPRETAPKSPKPFNQLVQLGLMAVLFGLSFAILHRMSWLGYLRSLPIEPATGSSLLPTSRDVAGRGDDLLATILAVVQEYYVDPERTNRAILLRGAIAKLALKVPFELEVDGNTLLLKHHGASLSIKAPASLSQRETIAAIDEVVDFLGTALHSPEKEVSGRDAGILEFLNVLLSSLDPHSALMSASEYSDLRQGTEGSFGGLGIVVGVRDNLLTVLKPLPNSPAERAGIKKLDRITRIDAVNTFGTSLDRLIEHMRGPPGSIVQLSLLSDGDISPKYLELKREVIQVNSVESELLENGGEKILHLSVESFAARTAQELATEVRKAEKELRQPLAGIVLDLRSNPGGLLDQAVEMADLFLSSGKIVSTRGRRQEVEEASRDFREIEYPLVVLINSESASASEIVAGALQDQGRALILGQPSFGKASVQTLFELPEDRALKLTIARYYTPSGRTIQNLGITPDIWLQAVSRQADNRNLLGLYRYKNENFLLNRLESANVDPDALSPTAAFKYYYLRATEADDTSKSPDLELALAQRLLSTIASSGQKTKGTARAQQWLMQVAATLNIEGQGLEQPTEAWLAAEQHVDWRQHSASKERPPLVKLDFGAKGSGPLPLAKHGALLVPWRLQNLGSDDLERVSIFVTSASLGIEATEVVVGRVAAGSTQSGTIKAATLPDYLEAGASISLGIAVDAVPLSIQLPTRPLLLRHAARPELVASISLRQDVGGVLPNVLESGEVAELEIIIKNQGDANAEKIRAVFKNLSGRQVNISEDTLNIGNLRAGETKKIYLKMTASAILLSDAINLGLSLRSESQALPVFSHYTVKAKPNMTRDLYGRGLAH